MKLLGRRGQNAPVTDIAPDDDTIDLSDSNDPTAVATQAPAPVEMPVIHGIENQAVTSTEESEDLSIVVPHANPAAAPIIVDQPETEEPQPEAEAAAPAVQAEGSVPGDMIEWFLNPEVPMPEQMLASPHAPTAAAGADLAPPTRAMLTSKPSTALDRFERPPLPEELEVLKTLAKIELGDRVGEYLTGGAATDDQLRNIVIDALADFMSEQNIGAWSEDQLDQLAEELLADVLGHGPIQSLLDDPLVSEIMVNGTSAVFVERAGRLHKTSVRFESNEKVRRVIDLIVSRVGRRIDESSPMVDARLPDGSRVNAIIAPLSVDGPMLTIRKFSKSAVTAQDMVAYQTLNWDSIALLRAAVAGRLNILISGGTGTGKTTLLNVCSGFIPDGERVVTIEDSVELRLDQEHVIRLESRPPNLEGNGEVTIRDLVRNSLRMRPDRIVVGECRGAEAIDMLQAMNTGHEGSLSTLHANSPRDALARLETMVLMAGLDLPVRAIREQVASAIDMIVHLERMRDGSRRVSYITEVTGMEADVISLSDIFSLDVRGVSEDGMVVSELVPTGVRPGWIEKLATYGIELPASTFGDISLDSLV